MSSENVTDSKGRSVSVRASTDRNTSRGRKGGKGGKGEAEHMTVGQCCAANPIVDRYVRFAQRILAAAESSNLGENFSKMALAHATSFAYAELSTAKAKDKVPAKATTGTAKSSTPVPTSKKGEEKENTVTPTIVNKLTWLPSRIQFSRVGSGDDRHELNGKQKNLVNTLAQIERHRVINQINAAARDTLVASADLIAESRALKKDQHEATKELVGKLAPAAATTEQRSAALIEEARKLMGPFKNIATSDSWKEFQHLKSVGKLPKKKDIEKFSKSLLTYLNGVEEKETPLTPSEVAALSTSAQIPDRGEIYAEMDYIHFPTPTHLGVFNPRVMYMTLAEKGPVEKGALLDLLQRQDVEDWLTPTSNLKTEPSPLHPQQPST